MKEKKFLSRFFERSNKPKNITIITNDIEARLKLNWVMMETFRGKLDQLDPQLQNFINRGLYIHEDQISMVRDLLWLTAVTKRGYSDKEIGEIWNERLKENDILRQKLLDEPKTL